MIVGFNIDSIDASKEKSAKGNLQVNYNPVITDVQRATVNAFDEDVAKISFDFTVGYEANGSPAAEILMSGNILWKGNIEEVTDAWDENEDLPDNIRAPLMNELYRKLLSEAVGISNTLSLLPPIPTPQVNQK